MKDYLNYWIIITKCRKGVRIGNYVEDMASEIVPEMESGRSQQRFVTSNQADFSPNERYGNDVHSSTLRTDIVLKYGKYGKSSCFSDTKQGIDFGDTPKNELIQARLQRLKEEQTGFQFQTEQHHQARMVGELSQEIRLQAKRSTCYPKSNGGQEYVEICNILYLPH